MLTHHMERYNQCQMSKCKTYPCVFCYFNGNSRYFNINFIFHRNIPILLEEVNTNSVKLHMNFSK